MNEERKRAKFWKVLGEGGIEDAGGMGGERGQKGKEGKVKAKRKQS